MIRVGFVLANSASWTGGLIYLRNLITTVMALPDRQIEPVLITTPETPDADLLGFEAITVLRTPLVGQGRGARVLRKASAVLLGRNLPLERFLRRNLISVLSHSGILGAQATVPSIAWLPDFQHVRMPEFFQPAEVEARDRGYARIAAEADLILLSSEDAKHDLAKFAPEVLGRSRILHFTAGMVRADDARGAPFLAETYGLERPYFYLPNQFWKHKNHRLVIDALALLAKEGGAPLVVSTGKAEDRRNPTYFTELMAHAAAVGVGDNFRVLGLVPYDHLSVLSREAVALINPSHFEGWSTTVEEAKSMGKAIILSDIPVHREQAPERGVYVPTDDPAAMEAAMRTVLAGWSHAADEAAMAAAAAALPARRRAFGETYQRIVLEAVARGA